MMEMPTPCYDCKGWFELNSLRMCFKCGDGTRLRCDDCDDCHSEEIHEVPPYGDKAK